MIYSLTAEFDYLIRMYTLERMFSSQLLECAKDELSFRTVVRDLQTKRPVLQIVLLNPNTWCSFGYCSSTVEQVPRINLYPAIKLLFSDCNESEECDLRLVTCFTINIPSYLDFYVLFDQDVDGFKCSIYYCFCTELELSLYITKLKIMLSIC